MLDPKLKAKLYWRCRRGMLELDLILQRFLDKQVDNLTQAQLQIFESLLTEPDPDLYAWLMGYEEPQDESYRELLACIRNTL